MSNNQERDGSANRVMTFAEVAEATGDLRSALCGERLREAVVQRSFPFRPAEREFEATVTAAGLTRAQARLRVA